MQADSTHDRVVKREEGEKLAKVRCIIIHTKELTHIRKVPDSPHTTDQCVALFRESHYAVSLDLTTGDY